MPTAHIPDITANPHSVDAHIAWFTKFQVISASVFSVATATSRMMEAMQTLRLSATWRSRGYQYHGWKVTYNPPSKKIEIMALF